jgi:threonine dehydrogenase-like Zn-dependent dehydrogenase
MPEAVDRARAFWVAEPGRGEIRTEQLPAPADGEALVRTLYSGVSRGTEALVFLGKVPRSEHARMRAPFQSGDFPAPVKYGYCNVGVVEQGPAALVGRHVFCLYPHQTRYVVPASALRVLPEGVPPARAVLAANLETAVNALWDAGPRIGDRIAVVGAGTVGCLAAWLAGFEATVLELSWYGDATPAAPLGGAFHSRRLTLKSSQVGAVAAAQRARWDHARRFELVLRLLAHPELDALVTGESRFDDLPGVLARLATSPGYTLCHRIFY